jgi:hypothetical protein
MGDELTATEKRFIQRCHDANTPIHLVEYHLEMARFDLREPDGNLYGSHRSVYTVAWERIQAEIAGRPWQHRQRITARDLRRV